jgi:predicted Zn-dependent protease
MEAKYEDIPTESRKVNVGEAPGHCVVLGEVTWKILMIHMVWLAMGRHLFRIVGIGGDEFREVLRDAVFTLRPLTRDERESVHALTLRIVAARDGETLDACLKRSGNVLPVELVALLNDLAPDAPLRSGLLLKIGRSERWVPRTR